MIKRDIALCSFIAVEMIVVGSFALLRKPTTCGLAPQSAVLSVPAAVAIGARPDLIGDSKNPFVLIEFGDYQCPPCISTQVTVKQTLARYQDSLRFGFRQYPLDNIHPLAMNAALIAEAAREQGCFWPMHEALYDLSGQLTTENIDKIIQRLGLNRDKLMQSRLSSAKIAVQRDRQDANKLGVPGTPTFILCCPDRRVIRLGNLSQVADYVK
ncbi:MAG TPA: thioredoxin domain-containing protein [Chthonomonadaceae bacterium]|nr:thioredoxin domain-containing protein [Chthonomonadaceae bacterium]